MADVPFSEVANLPSRSPDQTIAYGDSPLQVADYWQTESKEAPLLLLIHGGCWLNAYDRSHIKPLATTINDQGIAVLSIEYRRIGDIGGGWPGTFDDLRDALQQAFKLGHSDVFAAGHSAGGHLALWLGTQSTALKGVIGIAAISDLYDYSKGSSGCQRATISLMGGTAMEQPDHYAAASPMQLTLQTPVLMLHGANDAIVPFKQSEQFANKHATKLMQLDGKGHFDLIDPRGDTVSLIYQQIEAWLN